MAIFKHLLTHSSKQTTANHPNLKENQHLIEIAKMSIKDCLAKYESSLQGLTSSQARRRQFKYGKNEVVHEKHLFWPIVLLTNLKDPLSILLIVLATISFLAKDIKATVLISSMVLISIFLRFFQEIKADAAAKKLKAMVHTTARVTRQGVQKDIPLASLVPGDIVHLSAGDMVPGDLRILSSKDLFINQSTLTGESLPAEKHAEPNSNKIDNALEMQNLCFLGNNVENGTATALVLFTGSDTYLGSLAESLAVDRVETNFDQGIKKFTWLIMKFILIMVPVVFLLNGISRGDWFEAFIFSLAVAVGIAPEMLPMIVAVNLSKGALDMSKKKVLVKHLDSIQNFGAMDTLCTDKTGTITQGKVILEKYLDINGKENRNILKYAYLNSYFQTGLNNLLDAAILKHEELKRELRLTTDCEKIDEIPFDFMRRRMSVVIGCKGEEPILVCKGAIEETVNVCSKVEIDGKVISLANTEHKLKKNIEDKLNHEGFRVVAVAYKKMDKNKKSYNINDEKDLVLLGFLAFLDPPKDTAQKTIELLKKYGVNIKIITGDNELVTTKICSEVGLSTKNILLGSDLEQKNDTELSKLIEKTQIFVKMNPSHKERIVNILRQNGHTVGFMGDGINDTPALRAADVGISVNNAVDIAKESSDIILLEKELLVLKDGVTEGRKIFGNVVKYIQMAASSNFGNMFSVVGGSIFLPFLPMLPIQILINNLLYDTSQTAIPTDKIDEEYLMKPRQWQISNIRRFILYIGPVSSLFDYTTYFVMLLIFNAWANPALFHTGWFVESLLSQTLIIHIIRTNKIPFLQSRASWPLIVTTILVCAIGAYLPYSPLASTLGFTPLPLLYWLILLVIIIAYFGLTQSIKMWFLQKYKME